MLSYGNYLNGNFNNRKRNKWTPVVSSSLLYAEMRYFKAIHIHYDSTAVRTKHALSWDGVKFAESFNIEFRVVACVIQK